MQILVHLAFSQTQQLLGLNVAILQGPNEGIKLFLSGWKLILFITVHVYELLYLFLEVVGVGLGWEQDEKYHFLLL